MSLHGSLETFALTDVLALLSSTHKTGELRIVGERSQGSVWVDAGRLVQTAVGNAASHVDALFELLRLPSGMFTFEQGLPAPDPGEPLILEALVAKAEERLREWRSIEAVVPSAAVAVRLQASVGGDVTLTPEQWRMLVAAVDGGTVQSVCEQMELGEFDACKGVRDLVTLGVVRVEEAPEPKKAGKADKASKAGRVEPVVAAADAASEGETEGAGEAEPEADPFEALAAVAAAAGDAGAGDDEVDAHDELGDGDDDGTDEPRRSTEERDVLPGQPLPAWALGEDGDDDVDGSVDGDPDPSDAPGVAAEPRLRSLTTAVDRSAVAEALEAAEIGEIPEGAELGELGEIGENSEEPINRGLLLKFLSSVRS